MIKYYSESSLRNLFLEIYSVLKDSDPRISELWCEKSKISFFKGMTKTDMITFIENFDFISLKKGNYAFYLVIEKILFIVNCLKFLQYDITHLSEILDYSGFELLIKEILSRNNYHTTTNFRFSDTSSKKSSDSQKRFEIDVIGIYLKKILVIDAKQWKRKDSYGPISKAANLQLDRIKALKRNPESFSKLLSLLTGEELNIKKYLPCTFIPLMVTLENNSIKLNENQIPLVSIYEFNAFLQELPNNLHYFKTIKIGKEFKQNNLNTFHIKG
jgi:hypothetical protein